MTAIIVALATAIAGPSPLPDGKSIDTLMYSFSSDVFGLGPAGVLTIHPTGKVYYRHSSGSHRAGGRITQKEWDMPNAELAELFRKLVADGLLDIPEPPPGKLVSNQFTVTSGRWQQDIPCDKVPDKVMAHLRPLLAKAHPELWLEVPPPRAVVKPAGLTLLRYSFTPKVEGEESTITIDRFGNITYKRQTHPAKPDGAKLLVNEAWKIPAKDAEALLDGLITDGLFDLANTLGDEFPNHSVELRAGRWKTTFFPKALPEKVLDRLRPLLQKADRDMWK